jgi:hypothetical protein
VQSWLDRGWAAELIQESCRQQIVKRRGMAPSSIAYFEPGIAELVAWWATASMPAVSPATAATYGRPLSPYQRRIAERDAAVERLRRGVRSGSSEASHG